MIDTIVFDMGQVLIHWNADMFLDRHGLSEEDRLQLKRDLFATIEWVQLDRGSITEEEALRIIRARLPERLHGFAEEQICRWWVAPRSMASPRSRSAAGGWRPCAPWRVWRS